MTLVIGLTNNTDAVLVSDSMCLWSKDGVSYKDNDPYRKLVVLANPRFVVGLAGSTDTIRIIEEINHEQGRETGWEKADFQSLVADIRGRIEKQGSDMRFAFHGSLNFLFAGFHNGKPRLFLVTAQTTDQGERETSKVWFCDSKKAIGVEPHGALYLSYQYHSQDLSTAQMIELGAYSIRATCKHDPNVGQPIDYVIVREGQLAKIERLSAEDIAVLDSRIADVGGIMLNPLPRILQTK